VEYRLDVCGETVPVTAESEGEKRLRLSLPDGELRVRYDRIDENRIHVMLEDGDHGKSVDLYVADGPRGKEVLIDGISYVVQDADSLEQRSARKRGGKSVPQVVTPPMPSVVVKILVDEGQRVGKGNGVVVVSAMKMEATLPAPYDGVVGKINVSEGDNVSPGDILVDIEKDSTDTDNG